jgi:hypothetical protein
MLADDQKNIQPEEVEYGGKTAMAGIYTGNPVPAEETRSPGGLMTKWDQLGE